MLSELNATNPGVLGGTNHSEIVVYFGTGNHEVFSGDVVEGLLPSVTRETSAILYDDIFRRLLSPGDVQDLR